MAETHVITALHRKYAEPMGQIQKYERDADKIRIDLMHLEATMRLFKREIGVVTSVRPCKSSRWPSMGHGVRLAIDVMKAADKPLTLHEIAYATMERGKMPADDLQAVKDVAGSLRQSLNRRVGKGVVMIEGYPMRWAIFNKAHKLYTVCNT